MSTPLYDSVLYWNTWEKGRMMLLPEREESNRYPRCWHVVNESEKVVVLNSKLDVREMQRMKANSCIHYSIPKEVGERRKVKSTFLLLRCPVDIQISTIQRKGTIWER
jgi:hypothetical protein